MSVEELGPWASLSPTETVSQLDAAEFRWWIGGGRALDLYAGRSWRDHSDTDVGMVRGDVPKLRSALDGWDIHVASGGTLERWDGGPVRAERNQNNLWCRRGPQAPWALDVTVGDGDEERWIFRRDPRVRIPWNDAVLTSEDGIPYLAPELQLLFKSKDIREKDDIDAREVIPDLEPDRRELLARLLPGEHPWRVLLGPAR